MTSEDPAGRDAAARRAEPRSLSARRARAARRRRAQRRVALAVAGAAVHARSRRVGDGEADALPRHARAARHRPRARVDRGGRPVGLDRHRVPAGSPAVDGPLRPGRLRRPAVHGRRGASCSPERGGSTRSSSRASSPSWSGRARRVGWRTSRSWRTSSGSATTPSSGSRTRCAGSTSRSSAGRATPGDATVAALRDVVRDLGKRLVVTFGSQGVLVVDGAAGSERSVAVTPSPVVGHDHRVRRRVHRVSPGGLVAERRPRRGRGTGQGRRGAADGVGQAPARRRVWRAAASPPSEARSR